MKLLKTAEVCSKTGMSRSTIYKLEKNDPSFPRRRHLIGRRVAYIESEIDQWLSNLPEAQKAGTSGRKPGPGRGYCGLAGKP